MDFPYSLVVFDLDGTLVDSASDISEAVNRTLVDWSLPRVDETVIRGWIGDGARALVGSAFEHAGKAIDLDEVMPGFMVHYADCLLLYPSVYPGVVDTLETLRARGIEVAVCTNKPERFVRPLLEALQLGDYFECIVGGDTLAQRKPSAVPLLHVVEKFGLQVSQCLMVGDSATDVETAAAANMQMALVTYGYLRGVDPHAVAGVRVIDDLRELLLAA
ncbi:phosphoglycolate phosphatase [Pseudoxanthomonas gei]|uniref:Phosphoglycolate phosphatase n=1 Tax=Pseudoxanthomonas gei TaxID=1383030 RepID=A0ABX0AEX6_9GAMM|nr:phosphoglycolate phosphatase [Pseudoxanthomonas gei]NDK37794.1 phosphoglycolate phosphatase [Pseudoxanthomonas gei]